MDVRRALDKGVKNWFLFGSNLPLVNSSFNFEVGRINQKIDFVLSELNSRTIGMIG